MDSADHHHQPVRQTNGIAWIQYVHYLGDGYIPSTRIALYALCTQETSEMVRRYEVPFTI